MVDRPAKQPSPISQETIIAASDPGKNASILKKDQQVQQPSEQQEPKQEPDLSQLLEKNVSNVRDKVKLSFKVDGPTHFLLTCNEVNVSTAFHKLAEQPIGDESQKEAQAVPSSTTATVTEQEVKRAIDSMIKTAETIKSTYVKLEVGENIEHVFESFKCGPNFSFHLDPDIEIIEFKKKTTKLPLKFPTIFVPPYPSQVSDQNNNSKIYTIIQPYARSWTNIEEDNQRYIQLMGYVRYGWKMYTGTPWTEPTRVAVRVYPIPNESCSLEMASIAPSVNFSISGKLELTQSHLKDKDIGVDLNLEVGASAMGGSLKTPTIRINRKTTDQEQLKYLDIELKKIEFDDISQAEVNEVDWILERKYSKVKNSTLNRLDLNLYDPEVPLSLEQLEKIKLEEVCEPFADYVNFGVWKWDGQRVDFVFDVQHRFRNIIPAKKLFHHTKYETMEVNTSGGQQLFPIQLVFGK